MLSVKLDRQLLEVTDLTVIPGVKRTWITYCLFTNGADLCTECCVEAQKVDIQFALLSWFFPQHL